MIEIAKETPTFCLNYEMLMADPEPVVKQLFCFLLDVESVEGTLVGAQIEQVTRSGHRDPSKQGYKLKADTGRLCAKKHFYSAAMLSDIDWYLRDFMFFWGYASHSDPSRNAQWTTVTFDDATERDLQNHMRYQEINSASIKKAPLPKTQRQWSVNGYRPVVTNPTFFDLAANPRIDVTPKNP